MRKFLKWLFKRNSSEITISDWLTKEEIENIDDSNKDKMHKVSYNRKQFNDNMRDLAWISIAVVIIIGILTYYYMAL